MSDAMMNAFLGGLVVPTPNRVKPWFSFRCGPLRDMTNRKTVRYPESTMRGIGHLAVPICWDAREEWALTGEAEFRSL